MKRVACSAGVRQIGTVGLGMLILGGASPALALTTTYTDRASFEAQLGTLIVDDYSDAGYTAGDIIDGAFDDRFSDAAMSAVLGETAYTSTGFTDLNRIINQQTDPSYCAGCSGSFELDFTTTSVGTAMGVFGVGIRYINPPPAYNAFVNFGDGSMTEFPLATGSTSDFTLFFGITSDLEIQSIHFTFTGGNPTTSGFFGIDDLTIGNQVPEPSTGVLLASGLLALAAAKRARGARVRV